MRIKRGLLRLIPGIRVKLSFMMGIFAATIIAVATLFNYINQTRILEEGYLREIKAPIRYTGSIAASMDSTRTNILLLEDMKIRVKEKQESLRKYRRFFYARKDSLGNRFTSLWRKLGMNVSYDYQRVGYDTYYSIYLSTREIGELEKKVAEQLRHADGSAISPAEFRTLQSYGASVAYFQRRMDAIEKDLEAAASSLKARGAGQDEITRSTGRLKAALKRERYNRAYADRKFRNSLAAYYAYNFNRLEETGLSNSSIRIISHDTGGSVNFDTGALSRESIAAFSPLIADRAFTSDRRSFFTSQERKTGDRAEYDYAAGGRFYHVRYMPVYRNPATWERLEMIRKDISRNRGKWRAWLNEDKKYAALLSAQGAKLRARLEILKQGKTAPGIDSEYRALYAEYDRLLNERNSSLEKLAPYHDEQKNMASFYREEIAGVSAEMTRTAKKITELKKDSGKAADDDAKGRTESLQARMEEYRKQLAKLRQDEARSREDLGQSEKLTVNEAIRTLRDAALLDFAFLRQKNDPQAYRDYLSSSRARASEKYRYSALRRWVTGARSETSLSWEGKTGKTKPLVENAILAYSRSEVEEYMWLMDGTPVMADRGLFSADTGEGLLSSLSDNSITGYSAVLIDMTEGINRVKTNRDRMIIYSSVIAALAVLLTWFLAGFMVKRIRGIIGGAAQAGRGDLNVNFPERGHDEIGELGSSLNAMIRGLREKEELKSEIAAAGEIQKVLLPEFIPSNLEGYYSIGTFYRSMQGVGGDYYDLIELDENRLFFCIGDVSNHGVGPAIVMSMLRAHLHGIIKRGARKLEEILLELNGQIFLETPPHIFVTLIVCIIDRKNNTVEYCSAGHMKSVVYRYREDRIEILPGGGLPVGMDDNDFFRDTITAGRTELSPGDLFFQYTDGASEAMDASRGLFGEERLLESLKKYVRKHPDVMITRIAEAIEAFTGKKIIETAVSELNDDIAMIAFKRLGEDPGSRYATSCATRRPGDLTNRFLVLLFCTSLLQQDCFISY
jgi:serine phosphatase RsbU (regulator of sigma subunit)